MVSGDKGAEKTAWRVAKGGEHRCRPKKRWVHRARKPMCALRDWCKLLRQRQPMTGVRTLATTLRRGRRLRARGPDSSIGRKSKTELRRGAGGGEMKFASWAEDGALLLREIVERNERIGLPWSKRERKGRIREADPKLFIRGAKFFSDRSPQRRKKGLVNRGVGRKLR